MSKEAKEGMSKVEEAHESLERYGDETPTRDLLKILFGKDAEKMSKLLSNNDPLDLPTEVEGVSKLKVNKLKAAITLGKRLLSPPIRGKKFSSPEQIYEAYRHTYGREEQESFWVILLDARNRVMKEIRVAKGGLSSCPIETPNVFRDAIKEGSVSIILMHNHPSGIPDPSEQDKDLTDRVVRAGKLLGVTVLDHIVLCSNDYYAFANHGLI